MENKNKYRKFSVCCNTGSCLVLVTIIKVT